ncbi:hypothetical protein [Amycolatopsis jejuensis]|uniref:hypothetical protein n=1 Tax=Amycolatopsis jejuensis TaxID=330084 RepID=UPI0005268DD4|nr:hypothetical protein [Amycolatopsis jejuensis]
MTEQRDDAPAPSDSPIPRRSPAQQAELHRKLLSFDTFAGRLKHLLAEESRVHYRKDGAVVTDPDVIAASGSALRQRRASAQAVATWLLDQRGITISRQQINNIGAGIRPMPRASIVNGFADFWRIDARVLDPATPAEHLAGTLDTDTKLAASDWRILELMNDIGLESVQAREIGPALDRSTRAHKQALIEILSAISQDQKASTEHD